MIKRNQKLIRAVNLVSDSLLLFFSYFLSVFLRYNIFGELPKAYSENIIFFITLAGISIVFPFLYYAFRSVAQTRLQDEIGEYCTILIINGIGILLFGSFLFLARYMDFSRVALFLFWVLSSVLIIGKHFLGRRLILHAYALGYNLRRVIIVGNGVHADTYLSAIEKEPRRGFAFLGYIAAEDNPALGKRLGDYKAINRILEKESPDELVVALEPGDMELMPQILSAAGKEGIRVSLIPFYNSYIPPHPEIEAIGGARLINLCATPLDNIFTSGVKRIFDIIFSLLLLVLLSPLFALVAISIKLSSPGPVLFQQERVGKDKKIFKMYKFRSMRVNAREKTGWSTDVDPRRTRVGAFIRKYSIDELPQLWNVLKGDMSLVGPRPEVPFYVRQFKETVPLYLVRQQVRPGMTGWAQVHDLRGDTSIEARVEYDIWYIENWSLLLDIKILFQTVFRAKFVNNEKLS